MKKLFELFRNRKPKLSKKALADLAEIEKMLSGPSNYQERELADDEEERIFYDKSTGESRVEVVKKSKQKMELEKEFKRLKELEKSRYPESVTIKPKHGDQLSFDYKGDSYLLKTIHFAEEPEDCDILICQRSTEKFHIHTQELFKRLESSENNFLSEIDPQLLKSLETCKWHKSNFLDDSREYQEITISNKCVELVSHYLGIVFYLTVYDGNLYLLTSKLVDSEGIPVPDFVCQIDKSVFLRSSAEFDKDDEMWQHISSE